MANELIPSEDLPPGFVDDAARYVAGLLSLDDVAALHSISATTVMDRLAAPEVAAQVEGRAVDHRQSGSLARGRAVVLLNATVEQLQLRVDEGQLGAATLVRIADMAAKVAGVTAEKTPSPAEGARFSVNIIFGSDFARVARRVETASEVTDV